jgi:hypothetical protein
MMKEPRQDYVELAVERLAAQEADRTKSISWYVFLSNPTEQTHWSYIVPAEFRSIPKSSFNIKLDRLTLEFRFTNLDKLRIHSRALFSVLFLGKDLTEELVPVVLTLLTAGVVIVKFVALYWPKP